jgi:hypothetical protein
VHFCGVSMRLCLCLILCLMSSTLVQASALKMMSYSIQASPEKAWKELLIMTTLFVWALYMLATRGFGFFH